MKKSIVVVFVLLALTATMGPAAESDRAPGNERASSQERAPGNERTTVGLHLLGGGRYDNVRMCVGSPAGIPGGPIAEFYFDIRIPVSRQGRIAINIPVFRPIYFAIAFKMMQLEPVVMYEHILGSGTGTRPVLGVGPGVILHYGPDYESSQEDRGPSFFSIGPSVNVFAGLTLGQSNFIVGIKGFFSPLFTPGQPAGIVAGGGLELHYVFAGRQ